MKFFDTNGDGNIGYEEFISGLRLPLSARREAMVKMAFNVMDKDGSGVITGSDVKAIINWSAMDDKNRAGRTDDELLERFLNEFDGTRGNNDGKVTW